MNWEQLLSPARRGQKKENAEQSRSAFEQDFDRIIFSHPFRRLQDKTQVHPLPEHDFVHTRLTHSLEVSSVARSLGRKAGETVVQRHNLPSNRFSMFDFGAITAAAALAHDIGNPPFGHAGEAALSDFFLRKEVQDIWKNLVSDDEWNDLIAFEGNAEGFRLLNSQSFGARLTFATLGAFTKYPCSSSAKGTPGRKSQKKFGFYQSEKNVFEECAQELGLPSLAKNAWMRHPLAFLVEAADDICYSIIDLEDACRLGLVSFDDTVDFLAGILQESFQREKLDRILGQNEKISVLRAMAISRLVDECTVVFLDHEKDILDGKFDAALTDHCQSKDVLQEITKTSVQKIYRARQVVEIEASGHEVLPGLLSEFLQAGHYLFSQKADAKLKIPRKYQNISYLFPPETMQLIRDAESPYAVARLVLDVISGLTDKHALSLYRKMKGIAL